MITRKQYLAQEVSHQEYYGQFVTDGVRRIVAAAIGNGIFNSVDPHFNDIPLDKWDRLYFIIRSAVGRQINEANDSVGVSLSDTVCVAKEAARQIRDAANKGEEDKA